MNKELTTNTLSHYRIVSKIGAGGMGEVYLAEDTELGRTVALKVLPADVVDDKQRMHRFIQEAKTASALNHPNILTIHEIGHMEATHFIATEYVDGETLRQRMKSGPLKLGDVLDVTAQIASALSAAHAAGIVHRDIKPENIMLRRDGIAKVLDFGLAKLTERLPPDSVDTEAPTSFKTDPGTVVGTAVYMSPEQARGMAVDARTDIFSLGGVLYELVAGCLPFAGSTSSEVVASILSDKEPPPLARYSREVPAELERIVSKALRKEREQRYQTIRDLMLDLQSLKQQLEFEAKLERSMPPRLETTAEPSTVEAVTKPVSSSTSKIGRLTDALVHRRAVILAAAAVLILLAVPFGYLLLFRNGLTTAQPEIKSLAVIPLDNFSGDPAQDYLADGMTEALITELSKIGSLRVISRTSVMQYKAARKPLPEIGRELNVDAIVAGSVQRSGDKIGITAQLYRAATDQNLWANQYERELRDVFSLQREVARAIAREINVKLTPREQGLLANARPVNREAVDAYLKGRDFFNRGRDILGQQQGADSLKTSVGYFEQAVRIDPEYALAYTGLASANNALAMRGSPEFHYTQAKEAAKRALEIDETLAEAHWALAYSLMRFDWDWAGSEREYKRAIELDPNSGAHHGYAIYLLYLGRFDQAIQEINLAQELDPLEIPLKYNVGLFYSWAGQHNRAIEQYRRLVDTQPNDPQIHVGLGLAYMHQGTYQEGIAELRKASELSGGDASWLHLAQAYAVSGNRNEAINILDEILKSNGGPGSRENVASVYTALGDRDQAFAWLEKAYQERSHRLLRLKSSPEFDSLRSDARYQRPGAAHRLPTVSC